MGGILQVDTIQNNNTSTLITQTNATTITIARSGQTVVIPSGTTFNASSASISFPAGSIVNADIASSAAIATTKLGTGAVVKVVQAETSTLVSVSSTTYTDSNLTGSITPSSASNKILILTSQVLGVLQTGGQYATMKWKLMRGSTDIYASTTSGNGNFWAYDSGSSGIGIFHNISLCYLDSPSTTSSVTYKTQIAKDTNGGTSAYAQNESNKSIITLMEIAG